VVFILLAILVPIGLQQPVLNADGDPARHIRHGLYMLEHRSLIHQDPFSFTRPGAPFLGFEYGSQLAYGLAHRIGGLPAVAILTGLLIAVTYSLLAYLLLQWGVEPLLAYLTTLLAAVLGAGHWVTRPHLFSFVALILLLALLERQRPAPVWVFLPFFAIWANLHGGFVMGWFLIGTYLAGAVAEWLVSSDRGPWTRRIRYLAPLLAVAILATLINPHGFALQQHVLGFFGKHFIMNNTAEFLSPNFHEIDGRVFLIAILLTLAALALQHPRPSFPRLFTIGIMLVFGLISVRNVALYGLIALPLVALHVDRGWRALPDPRGIRGRFASTAARTSTLPWVAPAVLALALLAVAHGRVGSAQLITRGFDPETFPVAAVARAREARLEGRLFSEFAWGGYLIYAWPEQRIFIDGGTDFFGEDLFREYSRIKQLRPGWRDLLRKWDISLMLISRPSSLAHEVSREGVWTIWYCDSLAVLFQRKSGGSGSLSRAAADSAEAALGRCGGAGPAGDSHEGDSPGQGYVPQSPRLQAEHGG
jgi:hypothetical protein